MSSAAETDWWRTTARSPTKRACRHATMAGVCRAMNTVPTGLASVPPSGPAMPVMPMPTCVPQRARTPAASASATGSLTAPCSAMSAGGTSASTVFSALLYVITPPSTHAELPGTSVRRAPSMPPVQDSATATRQPVGAEQPARDFLQRFVGGRVDRRPERRRGLGDRPRQRRVGSRGISGPREQVQFDAPEGREDRRLERQGRGPPRRIERLQRGLHRGLAPAHHLEAAAVGAFVHRPAPPARRRRGHRASAPSRAAVRAAARSLAVPDRSIALAPCRRDCRGVPRRRSASPGGG